jgi:biotin transport system substrate-specific component
MQAFSPASALLAVVVARPASAPSPSALAPRGDEGAAAAVTTLTNAVTGTSVTLRARAVAAGNEAALARRVREAEPVGAAARVVVDWPARTYRLSAYPPLAFLVGSRWFVPLGALLIAACAQIRFLFPCASGFATVTWGAAGASYCVPQQQVHLVTAASCPADICSQRIPVTMQTFAVLLNGALAGATTGTAATALYVLLVCLGAPFGAGGVVDPVWLKGAIVSPSGGYLLGFVAASWIMGRCAERGYDRARRVYWLALYMFAAEGAIYLFGLFWLPFGLAIKSNVAPHAICPTDAGTCLKNVFTWGFTPFIPGDLFKMLLVGLAGPLCHEATRRVHRWRTGYARPGGLDEAEAEAETAAAAAAAAGGSDEAPDAATLSS